MSNIKDNLLQLIGKTPLVRLSNIYKDEYGTEIIAKVEYFNPGGSVKDRAAYAMIEAAETSGKLKKDGVYVATVGYPVGMPGSTNTIKILTPSEMEYYLNFKEKKETKAKEKKSK